MKFAPQTWLAGSVVVMFLVWAAATHLALRAPVLGLRLNADERAGLVVQAVADDSPNRDRLQRGQRMIRLAGVELTADLRIEEPDQLPDWPAYDEFMSKQKILAEAFAGGAATAVLDDGSEVEIRARPRRLTDLPFMFWFQLVVGSLGYLIGAGVFAFRSREAAARHFAAAGLGMLVFTHAAAIYSGRELVMDGALIERLSMINHLGAFSFTGALVALLWSYPRRLRGEAMALGAYLAALVLWSGFAWQWLPDMGAAHLATLLLFATSFVLAFFQWRATRRFPMERAALKWYLLSIYFGTGLFAALILLPVAVGMQPPADQGLMFVVFLFMFGGIALGIVRYRLFDLDRWWFRAWTWFLGGVSLIVLDVALVRWLDISQLGALALSLAVLGWVYFPLRQWAWQRLVGRGRRDQPERVGHWLRSLATADNEAMLQQRWRQVLQQDLEPLSMVSSDAQALETSVSHDGQALRVPDLDGQHSWLLRHPGNGSRLFSDEDRNAAQALLEMARHVRDGLRDRQQVVQAERNRIMRDLHDDLGAKLLSLVHLSNAEAEQIARSAMQDMRDVLTALEADPADVHEALEEWRLEAQERTELMGRELRWENGEPAAVELNARQRTNLSRILREGITNACRHTADGPVTVRVDTTQTQLEVTVNAPPPADPAVSWREGRGMRTVKQRAEDLGGRAVWLPTTEGRLEMRVEIPLREPTPDDSATIASRARRAPVLDASE